MSPKPNAWCPYEKRKGRGETHRRRLCEDGGRVWRDAATSQETPRVADKHEKAGERPEGTSLAPGFISDLWPSGLPKNTFLLFQAPSLGLLETAATGN